MFSTTHFLDLPRHSLWAMLYVRYLITWPLPVPRSYSQILVSYLSAYICTTLLPTPGLQRPEGPSLCFHILNCHWILRLWFPAGQAVDASCHGLTVGFLRSGFLASVSKQSMSQWVLLEPKTHSTLSLTELHPNRLELDTFAFSNNLQKLGPGNFPLEMLTSAAS